MQREKAELLSKPILESLSTRGRTEICGDYRRGKRYVKSIILVTLVPPLEVKEILKEYDPTSRGNVKTTALMLVEGFPVYAVSTTEPAWGATTLFFTGPYNFKQCICSDAKIQGYLLNKSGLWVGKERVAGKTEEQIFQCLGLEYKPPENRMFYMTEQRREYNERRLTRPAKEGLQHNVSNNGYEEKGRFIRDKKRASLPIASLRQN
jgi:DNA polymerase/3'-5' exonuclease PolX